MFFNNGVIAFLIKTKGDVKGQYLILLLLKLRIFGLDYEANIGVLQYRLSESLLQKLRDNK